MPGSVHEKYREIVDAQPRCEEAWFPDALRRLQGGDEAAAREISGALLRVALELAETASLRNASLEMMDLVQEANTEALPSATCWSTCAPPSKRD